MTDDCYITTPIYYINDQPHIGIAHTTVLADVLARFRRLQGKNVFFLTGTDEHGQKVRDAALENGIDPKTQADRMVVRFQESWKDLDISHDDFIRTTESRHTRLVESVLRGLWDNGEIYLGEYEGWYCVPDERFWTEKDLADGRCPDCGRPVERIAEANYFFRMGKYQDWLIGYVNDPPRAHTTGTPSKRGPWIPKTTPRRPLHFKAGRTPELGYQASIRQGLRHLCLVRRAYQLPNRSRFPVRRRGVRAPLASRHPPDRQGHPHHPCSLLANDAQGDRSFPTKDHLRSWLVERGWDQDVEVCRQRGQAIGPCGRIWR